MLKVAKDALEQFYKDYNAKKAKSIARNRELSPTQKNQAKNDWVKKHCLILYRKVQHH
jgi:hypothetical protein